MLFNTFVFWLAFPVIFVIYWLLPQRGLFIKFGVWSHVIKHDYRNLFLIIVSYILYMNWKPTYVLILFGITLITYLGARLIEKKKAYYTKKYIITLFVLIALLPLFVFKYFDFLTNTVSLGLAEIGLKFTLNGLNWAIPVGISFFTFQAISYLWDVYYKRYSAEHSFIDYVLYVSFFPQITSGPISKASELLPQIKEHRNFNYKQGVDGLKLLLWGMFLKVVVADRLGLYVDKVYEAYNIYNGTTCLLASFFYSIQIYGDFAGYSLMAVGIAKTLGFNLINNFNRPYFSISITEFWRRWHISLSRWLKDYIYIPLGGSKCSKTRNYWNIIITFLISGIWHGANWTFIVWGILHGIFQIVEKVFGFQKSTAKGFTKVVRILITFCLVNIAWIFFRMPTISAALDVMRKIFLDFGKVDTAIMGNTNILLFVIGIFILFFKEVHEEFFSSKFNFINRKYLMWVIYIILFCMIISIGVLDSGQFIYANF